MRAPCRASHLCRGDRRQVEYWAGAIGEARARSNVRGLRGKKYAEVNAVMEELADDLQRVAEGPAGPPVRCRALEALFWFQVTAFMGT